MAIAAAAALAIGPAPAVWAQTTLVDDTFADFAAAPTTATTWAVEPGAVRLRPADLSESFEDGGPALPTSLTSVPWPGAGSAIVGSGALTVDNARVHPAAISQTAPQVMEFRATFAGRHLPARGLCDGLQRAAARPLQHRRRWLPLGLYARTDDGGGSIANTPIAADPLEPHTYRIEWLADEVRYLVDGALVATHVIAVAGPMRPAASDFGAGCGLDRDRLLGHGRGPGDGCLRVPRARRRRRAGRLGKPDRDVGGRLGRVRDPLGQHAGAGRDVVGLAGGRGGRRDRQPDRPLHPVQRDAEPPERRVAHPRSRRDRLRGRQRRAGCGDRLGRCRRRFGVGAVLEPGVGRRSVRVPVGRAGSGVRDVREPEGVHGAGDRVPYGAGAGRR